MNSTTNATAATKNPWEESGAMVYVALTVATFSAVTMCCVWFFKQRWLKKTTYGTVNHEEQDIELTADDDSEEEIPLDDYKDVQNPPAFTLDDSDEDGELEQDHPDSV